MVVVKLADEVYELLDWEPPTPGKCEPDAGDAERASTETPADAQAWPPTEAGSPF